MDETKLNMLLESNQAPPVREMRVYTKMRTLIVSGAVDVVYARSETPTIIVAVPSREALDNIETIMSGESLEVRRKPISTSGAGSTVRIDQSGRKTVIASGPGAIASGGGNAHMVIASGRGAIAAGGSIVGMQHSGPDHRATVLVLQPDAPDVRITGSGTVVLTDVQRSSLELRLEGAGSIKASGAVDALSARVEGSGDIKSKNMQCRVATCIVAGAGSISVNVNQSIRARISGVGDITVYGNPPQRDAKVTGVGSIRYKA